MDNRTIEKFAANAVQECILNIDRFHPQISENDKTLSWDGFIEVFKSGEKTKANFDGRVDVQVKGTMNNNHPSEISFAAETSDLRNYLNNGGVIYFVVRIHKQNTFQRKVYYASLTPVKLKHYLKGVEEQKTKSIKLQEFPPDKFGRIDIIIDFLRNSRQQSSHVHTGFISMEDVYNSKRSYKITTTSHGKATTNSVFSALLGKEVYAYVTLEGSSALIPVDTPLTIEELREKVNARICVGDKCYYESYQRITSTKATCIQIGKSITLTFDRFDAKKITVNVQLSPILREATKDMRFIVDAINAHNFNIGSIPLGVDFFKNAPVDLISIIQKRLGLYEKITKLFNLLKVTEDLNLEELTEDEQNNIDILIRAIVNKQRITNITSEKTISIINLKVSNFILKLIILRNDDSTHSVVNFFDSQMAFSYKDENGKRNITTPYSVLSKEDYLTVSNICFECILESYKKAAKENVNLHNKATNDILQMLLAYDEKPNRKLLGAIKDVTYWILIETNQVSKNIKILNYLQTVKRERPFNQDEIRQLSCIVEDLKATKQEKIGAYLLLDSKLLANTLFEELKVEDQKQFKRFPISRFFMAHS